MAGQGGRAVTVTQLMELEYNGLLLAAPIYPQTVEGLVGLPELRTSDRALLARNGMRPGTDRAGGRTIALELEVVAYAADEFSAALEALKLAFRVGPEVPLSFRQYGVAGGAVARVYARARRLSVVIDHEFQALTAMVQAELFATDPLIYAEAEQSIGTVLAAGASSGLTFPLTYPRTYGLETGDGRVSVSNVGNTSAPWVAVIVGPAINPIVENVTTGEAIKLNIVLADGEWLVVDSAARTIMLNGTASRYSALDQTSRWWLLRPGLTEVSFRASTFTSATMTITWRSTWL